MVDTIPKYVVHGVTTAAQNAFAAKCPDLARQLLRVAGITDEAEIVRLSKIKRVCRNRLEMSDSLAVASSEVYTVVSHLERVEQEPEKTHAIKLIAALKPVMERLSKLSDHDERMHRILAHRPNLRIT